MNHEEKIAEMENAIAADYSNIAGMVVLKDGKAVYENYFEDCTRESRIHVFSVTKSIVSILFGIALDKGYLDNIDRKVLDFYKATDMSVWVADPNGINTGGNIIYINSDCNMVIAIASHFKPTAKDRIEFIRQYVEPAFL